MKLKIKIPQIKLPKLYIYGIDVIKNSLFFAFYILLTIISIALLIAPAVKVFKKNQREYYEIKVQYDSTLAKYNQTKEELDKLKEKNKKIILALKRDFNPNNFKNFASKYMDIKEIKELNQTTYKNDFVKTTYIANATIKSPKNFYDLIDALNDYKYVLRIYFPINFQKQQENIALSVKIEHFKLKNTGQKHY